MKTSSSKSSVSIFLILSVTEFKIKGANKGIATLFLYLLNPDKYNIWNNATESGLKKMGLLVNVRGKHAANKYRIINEAAIEFRNSNKLVPQEIDWFLTAISRSKSEKQQTYSSLFLEIMEKYRSAKTDEYKVTSQSS